MKRPAFLLFLFLHVGCSSEARPGPLIADASDETRPAETGTDAPSADSADVETAESTDPFDDCSPSVDAGVGGLAYRATVLADAPVAYWPLDDAAGSAIVGDLMKGAHHATVIGKPAFGVAGAFGGDGNVAMRFDAASYLDVGPTLEFTSSFTLEAWVRPAKIDAEYRFVLGKERFGAARQGFELYFTEAETSFLRWTAGKPSGQAKTGFLEVGRWVHLVVRYDAAKRVSSLIVDGVRHSSNPDFGGSSDVSSSGSFTWGAASSIGGNPLDGAVLDELAVYDRVLPCARAKAHFLAAKASP